MTPNQFLLTRQALGLTQAGCGRFLATTARQIRRYERGEREVPVPTALLLRGMVHHGDVPEVPKRPRGRSY
jgi:transcriptional regulator with XRE-family HTH domain